MTPEYFIIQYGSGFQDLCRNERGYYQTIARKQGTNPWRINKTRFMVEGGVHNLGSVTEVTRSEVVAIALIADRKGNI